MAKKIIQLTKIMIPGVMYTAHHLGNEGYSSQLLAKYIKNGLIESPYKGVYILKGHKPSVFDLVYTLQIVMQKACHIASKSALSIKGINEQLNTQLNPQFIQLNTAKSFKKPLWLKEIEKQHKYKIIVMQSNLFNNNDLSVSSITVENKNLIVSDIERAIFEMLDNINSAEDFFQADRIFETLPGIRVKQLTTLIRNCNSIKVKRLILYFTNIYFPDLFLKLNETNVDLGKGSRTVTHDSNNSKYIREFKLIVPREYNE